MLAWLGLLAAAAPPHVYHVDLSRAALALEEGEAARARILAAREARTAQLQDQRQRLLVRRGRMPPSAYAKAVDALNASYAAAETELDELQAKLLGPMTERLEALIAKANTGDTVVLVADDVEILRPNRLCDRTAWLVEAYRGKDAAPERVAVCRRKSFARLRVAEVVKGLPEAEKAARRLKALQAKRQQSLDRRKRAVDALTKRAATSADPRLAEEAAAQRDTLDQDFLRFQNEIQAEETAASTRLRRRATDAGERAARAHPDVLFYVGEPLGRKPACDVTAWVLELAQGAAEVAGLPGGCR